MVELQVRQKLAEYALRPYFAETLPTNLAQYIEIRKVLNEYFPRPIGPLCMFD